MVASIKKQLTPTKFKARELNKSAGILDDYAVRKNIHTREGTITRTPVNEIDIVNKAYVDSVAGRGSLDLFLTENSSDIATYFDLEVDVVTAAKENIVQSITAGSTTLIASFATILNNAIINEIRLLESGIFTAHLHAEGAAAKNLFLYAELYHRTSGGTETLLSTSHDSGELTTSEAGYDIHGPVADDKAFVSGDRIVTKIYGRNDGGANKNITIYMEGDTAARAEFPALLNVSTTLWEIDGSETQLKTADEIDMQTKKIINVVDPTADQEAATKKFVDDHNWTESDITDLGSYLENVSEDTTPELGGEMDAGSHTIGFTQQTATGDGTTTIDWRLGNKFYFTFGAQNDTFTFTAPTNPCNLILVLKQDGTGSRIPTFPGTVLWSGGSMPTFSTGIAAVDIVAFYYDGTNYFGVETLDFS